MTTNLNSEEKTKVKRIAITNAFLWAVINIIIFLLVYYAAPTLMANPTFGFITIAIGIGLAIYFILDLRKKVGGYWSFREALGNIFLMFFVQVVVYTIFTTAFAKWIEPEYANMMRDATLNATTKMAETFSSDQEVIDKMIEEAEKSIEKQVNPGFMDFVQGLAIAAIFYFIGALIFAAIFKRERPVFAPAEEEQ
ncbi:hypothetical protein GCM10007415_23630 [Parapedobacter pyrenivorans]|uniref:DUF4199 domain-containing protein n=1 Tax=Parapedobacter pyrenivorans TaxID=1305674 RepID=A0A917HTN6_9SPHI|nr:DUF4199 domain-containing protein [Parapedobacter pyrenivorans]GGG88823.1 hypothetical protein GCM10007415_23630 [Parapedobacter pyrenivorans]